MAPPPGWPSPSIPYLALTVYPSIPYRTPYHFQAIPSSLLLWRRRRRRRRFPAGRRRLSRISPHLSRIVYPNRLSRISPQLSIPHLSPPKNQSIPCSLLLWKTREGRRRRRRRHLRPAGSRRLSCIFYLVSSIPYFTPDDFPNHMCVLSHLRQFPTHTLSLLLWRRRRRRRRCLRPAGRRSLSCISPRLSRISPRLSRISPQLPSIPYLTPTVRLSRISPRRSIPHLTPIVYTIQDRRYGIDDKG